MKIKIVQVVLAATTVDIITIQMVQRQLRKSFHMLLSVLALLC